MRAIPAGKHIGLACKYISEKTGIEVDPAFTQGLIVVDSSGNFAGAFLINMYRGFDCYVSCASETPMAWRPHVRRAIADYVFGQLGCVRATAVVRKNNRTVRKVLEHLGFVQEGRLRRGYDGVKDALIYGILAGDCDDFTAT